VFVLKDSASFKA